MKKFCLFFLGLIFFLSPQAVAQNKVIVIPLLDNDTTPPVACTGTLSAGERWCDKGDGTVKDMTTKLIWLKDAGWGGSKPWRNPSTDCSAPDYTCYDDAHLRVGILWQGTSDAGLSDGSQTGDWRLPRLRELLAITEGIEPISPSSMRFFTNVQELYWSSGSYPSHLILLGMYVNMTTGTGSWTEKYGAFPVWAVKDSD